MDKGIGCQAQRPLPVGITTTIIPYHPGSNHPIFIFIFRTSECQRSVGNVGIPFTHQHFQTWRRTIVFRDHRMTRAATVSSCWFSTTWQNNATHIMILYYDFPIKTFIEFMDFGSSGIFQPRISHASHSLKTRESNRQWFRNLGPMVLNLQQPCRP
jgi:hypothetical protein